MSQRQLASVLFAVLGTFVAITSVPQVVFSIGVLTAGVQAAPVAYAITFLIGTIISVTFGIVLVLIRVRLAERLFPADTGSLAARDTQAVALSVLGLLLRHRVNLPAGWAWSHTMVGRYTTSVGRRVVPRSPRGCALLGHCAGSTFVNYR